MSKHKFVYADDMVDGMPTLGVVYHMLKERDIKRVFHELDRESPAVLGYVVVDEEEEDV